MQEINLEELSKIKVLPYDIKDNSGKEIIKAGEILTPGKLLSLKNKKIYKVSSPITESDNQDQYFIFNKNDRTKLINIFSLLIEKVKNQDEYGTKDYAEVIANEIYSVVYKEFKKVNYLSQFRLTGNYRYTHNLNSAILSCIICLKQGINEINILSIMLATLFCDISLVINDDFENEKAIKNHPTMSYRILNKLNFGYDILNLVLNHHENLDGSGYPNQKFYNTIPKEAMIINICCFFDDLFKSEEIKTYKDAFKIMLGTRHSKFSLDILYTLVNSYKYGDIKLFEGNYD